jgi:hypothetical protein
MRVGFGRDVKESEIAVTTAGKGGGEGLGGRQLAICCDIELTLVVGDRHRVGRRRATSAAAPQAEHDRPEQAYAGHDHQQYSRKYPLLRD